MREYELEVLEQYDIEVRSTRKIRGAFFCDTNEGTMLLKEAHISDRRATLLYIVQSGLEGDGFGEVDTPVFNKEGKLISVSRDSTRYLLKKWFYGRECDIKRGQEILAAAENLARLHKKLQWQEVCSLDEGARVRPAEGRQLQEELKRHNRELKKVRTYMRNKVSKGEFEFLFLKHFDRMYCLAEDVLTRLGKSGYDSLYEETLAENKMVHGDYNYHNVLFGNGGRIVTTNFEHFRIDVQAQDLYYFLRKIMEKHQWDEELGRAMLRAYHKVRPLDEREMEYIAICLAYPEKFWKTANTYYHSNKAWVPEKNVEKLQTAIIQTEQKLRFIENIFTFNL